MEMNQHPRTGRVVMLVIAMVLVAGIVTVALLRDRIVNNPQYQVSIIGQGKISYQPDRAKITLGVQIDKATDAATALADLNKKIDAIVKAVNQLDAEKIKVETQNYSLSPSYDYVDGVSQVGGYNANQQLLVEVTGIDQQSTMINKVIETASQAGINQVLSITFDTTNLENLKQEARIMAINDAKSKAGSLAEAAGVTLGKVVGWWENIVAGPMYDGKAYYSEVGGMGAGGPVTSTPNVPVGDQELIMEVTLNYRVK
ncbi:MAG: SIMPL domain-containing protein [bacterium]